MSAEIIPFPNTPRAISEREWDEKMLRVFEAIERTRGKQLQFDEPDGPQSPYLRRALRSEAEARVERLLREQIEKAWSRLHTRPMSPEDENESYSID